MTPGLIVAVHRVPRVDPAVVPVETRLDPHLRDLAILMAMAWLFTLTLYLLNRRVARQRELEEELGAAHTEIASLRTRLAEATRPPTQFARTQDPAALSALARFATSQAPVLADLRGRVPVASEPLVDDLLRQLGQVSTAVRTAAARCGPPCVSVPVAGLESGPIVVAAPTTGEADRLAVVRRPRQAQLLLR